MQPILLEFDGWLAIVYRLPCARMPLFQLLTTRLLREWESGVKAEDGTCIREPYNIVQLIEEEWRLFQAIAAMLQTEAALPLTIADLKDRPDLLQWLFICQRDAAGALQPGELVRTQAPAKLHQVKRREEDEDEMSLADVPFPSTGDPNTDTLGNLLFAFGDLASAKLAYEWLDITTIQNVVSVRNELSRPPDDRLREHLLNCFDKAQELDPTMLDRALGLLPNTPQETSDAD